MLSACAVGIETATAAISARAEKTRTRVPGLCNVILVGCWDIYRLNGTRHQRAIPGLHRFLPLVHLWAPGDRSGLEIRKGVRDVVRLVPVPTIPHVLVSLPL